MIDATHILTVRSKTGKPVGPLSAKPSASICIFGLVDLARELAGVRDPDLEVDVREIPAGLDMDLVARYGLEGIEMQEPRGDGSG